MKYSKKNILIISHNPLSVVNNNGKTLASIFEGVPKKNIYQIYLNADIPDYSVDSHYLQINEKQIISSFICFKNQCCKEVEATPGKVCSVRIRRGNFANHTKRLLRECIWKFPIWKSRLKEWLQNKKFDVVFFMAGDGLFAYDVYSFVMSNMSVKGCLFFTDDYIIGKTSYSPIALLRQFLLKKKIKKTLKITKEMYVISEPMKEAYKKIFNKDGYIIRNFSVEKKEDNNCLYNEEHDPLIMVYAGGLHYNRWKVLSLISQALKRINEKNGIKCHLKVYSSQNISNDIINSMVCEGASSFMGGASASQIADIYASSDILLHVESFEKKAMASTKYSFSTKIPEYMSAGKCLLAVGPSELASIKYLSDFSCVLNNVYEIYFGLEYLLNNTEYRKKIECACKERYSSDFSAEKQAECLERILTV